MPDPPDDALYAPPRSDAHDPPSPGDAPKRSKRERVKGPLALLDAAGGEQAGDAGNVVPAPPAAAPFLARACVTLGAALVASFLEEIWLPGIDEVALMREHLWLNQATSVVSLGVMPVLSAYGLVEVGALVVPRWRKLRHGGAEARRKLDRVAAVLVLALALFQAYGVAVFLRSMGALSGGTLPILVALPAGTFALWGLAGAVSRYGLGNGLVWIFSVAGLRASLRGMAVGSPGPGLVGAAGGAAAGARLSSLLTMAAVCAATVMVTRLSDRGRGAAGEEGSEGPRRLAIPAPACGLQPLGTANQLFQLAGTLVVLVDKPDGGAPPAVDFGAYVRVALVLGLGVLFTVLFHWPSRLDALLVRAGVAGASASGATARFVRSAMPATLTFLLVLWLAARVSPGIDVFSVALLSAWGLDLVADLRARRATPRLVRVWIEQRPGAAVVVREVLASRGITAHLRGLAARTMLQFGCGYAPIEVHVPAASAARAERYLAAVLPDEIQTDEKTTRKAKGAKSAVPVALAPADGWGKGAIGLGMIGAALLILMLK